MKLLQQITLSLCLLAALFLLREFLSHPRAIWTVLDHDRNGHYGYGQDMALALEQGNVVQFFAQFEKGKVWPPLHGLFVAATQVLTGNDWRFAVLPSLFGWVITLWCACYTAQKISAPTGLGWAAGIIALDFAMISPGGRIYATDVMLESLGAGLTMASLACYARAVEQRESRTSWRLLAIVFTLLFFEKYNYWLIVAVSLSLAEAGVLLATVRGWLRGVNLVAVLRGQLREPLNWLLLALVALIVSLYMRGPIATEWFGRKVSLYPPNNLITAAYAVLLFRILLGLRRTGWKPHTAQGEMLWRWHILPVAVSFLLPQRLSVFFEFLSPSNSETTHCGIPAMIAYYWRCFVTDYNVTLPLAFLAVVLACVAFLRFKTFGPAARAVLFCVAVGALLNVLHPNHKSRFLHSWIPALWTAAGIGAAVAMEKLPRRSSVAATVVAAVALFGGWGAWISMPAKNSAPAFSLLDMSDLWLSDIRGSHRVAFCASQPARPFMQWTFLKLYRSRDCFEWPAWQSANSADKLREGFEQWLATTTADAIVYLEVQQPGSPSFGESSDAPLLRGCMQPLMARQTKFKETKQIDFPLRHCVVIIWRATAAK
jgi:hypothetical protein